MRIEGTCVVLHSKRVGSSEQRGANLDEYQWDSAACSMHAHKGMHHFKPYK